MTAITSQLSEAELHGLIDGHLEADRRADILRRAAASTTDRDRIEAWQEQADLIRRAFRGVDKEAVPSTFDLQSPARLLSLPPLSPTNTKNNEDDVAPLVIVPNRARWRQCAVGGITVAIIASGLAGAWFAAASSPIGSDLTTTARDTVEDILAARTAAVLAAAPPTDLPTKPVAMPTSSIPDLTSVGFTLSGADTQPGEPVSLVFRYRNGAAEQIVIGVARAPHDWQRGLPGANRDVVVWRVGGKAYAIAGTLRPERLRAIAASLRDEAIEE